MLFSQKAESSSKALAQRALRTVDNRVQKVEGIQQLNELYEQLGHPAQLSLGLLTRHVRLALASDSGVEALLALTGDDQTCAITNLFDVEGDETDDEDDAVSAVVCVNEHCWVVIELADYATVLQQ